METKANNMDLRTTKEVFDHHNQAFKAADIEAVMSDFAEETTYVTANGVAKGKDAIREIYLKHFATALVGDSSTIISLVTEGEIVLFEWTAKTATIRINDGVDTFVIRDGSIVAQTARSTPIPKT